MAKILEDRRIYLRSFFLICYVFVLYSNISTYLDPLFLSHIFRLKILPLQRNFLQEELGVRCTRLPHSSEWARVPLSSFFFKFLYFLLIFLKLCSFVSSPTWDDSCYTPKKVAAISDTTYLKTGVDIIFFFLVLHFIETLYNFCDIDTGLYVSYKINSLY